MKCEEVQSLHGPYLDSELDAKNSLEIEQHLKACPVCARLFAEAQKLDARLMAGLNQGSRTAQLWEQVERSVIVAGAAASGLRPQAVASEAAGWAAVLGALRDRVRAGWQTSRWAWTGLAAVWVVILGLNSAAPEPVPPSVAGQGAPPVSEVRFALKQKYLLMAGLAFTPEAAETEKPKTAPPSPRSDRRKATFNT
jgi:anti-sigma factor RsiW